MRTSLCSSLCIMLLGAMVTVAGGPARAAESPATDCLVGIQNEDEQQLSGLVDCTDGAACDADGATDRKCVFRIRGALNIPAAGCTPRVIKKVKFKTQKARNLIVLTPVSGQASSVFGSFVDFTVNVKQRGNRNPKPGKRKVQATAKADGQPRANDKDKATLQCTPCPSASCVPPTTTSTTVVVPTTTTTSTTLPACGDGTVNGTEACDPAAATTGCAQGETCMPPGAISECTCKTCTPINPVQTLQFTTSDQTTDFCGDQGLITPPNPPTSGTVTTDTNATINLGAGCLYIGGGGGSVPGGVTPDGSQSNFDLTLECGGETVIAAQTGDSLSCTKGAGPGKACINDLTGWPNLQACTTDNDCPMTGSGNTVSAGSCVDKPNCLFGPPLPIENGPLSTCVVNTIGSDASGSVMPTTGEAQVTLPLRSHTFIRPPGDTTPCPVCTGGVCSTGARVGLACTPTSPTSPTTIDCPPTAAGGAYLPEFQVNLEKLTTGVSTKTNPDGLFCPNQRTFSAFGGQSPTVRPPNGNPGPIKIVTITENGSPAGDLTTNMVKPATLSAVFCIPETGNGIIDGAADLAGPGATSLPGTVQILP